MEPPNKKTHKIIKFTGPHENGEIVQGNHLRDPSGDGEGTACGIVFSDYDHEQTEKEKGGITCERCLDIIKYYKAIKL